LTKGDDMTTDALPTDLLTQADAFDQAADALSPRIADPGIDFGARQTLFVQSQRLRQQAFDLRTQAALGIVKALQMQLAALHARIDEAQKALKTIADVKRVIDVAAGLATLATAIAGGQPAAISSAFGALGDALAPAVNP
jgi:hypothetical protein